MRFNRNASWVLNHFDFAGVAWLLHLMRQPWEFPDGPRIPTAEELREHVTRLMQHLADNPDDATVEALGFRVTHDGRGGLEVQYVITESRCPS